MLRKGNHARRDEDGVDPLPLKELLETRDLHAGKIKFKRIIGGGTRLTETQNIHSAESYRRIKHKIAEFVVLLIPISILVASLAFVLISSVRHG